MIGRYQPAPQDGVRHADAAFMLAALHYLLDEMPAADDAIERAIQNGDQRASTASLRHLIGRARAAGVNYAGTSESRNADAAANRATAGDGDDY